MASPLTSSQFAAFVLDKLDQTASAKYKDLPSMIDKLFTRKAISGADWKFAEIGAVPDIPEFNGKLSSLSIAPGYSTTIEPKEYAAEIIAERKLLDDEMYGVLENRAIGLMESAHRKEEKLAVRVFANAASSAFDFQTSEEGVALLSSSHTTKSGTSTTNGFDNSGTSAASKTAVAATRILMRQFRNDISERIDMDDSYAIVCPDALADTFSEINQTPYGYDTAARDKNMSAGRYEVIPYLRLDDSDANNWFMVNKTMMAKSLFWLDRIRPEQKNTIDFSTYQTRQAIYMRVAAGFIDWRWIYGHIVT